MLSSHCGLLTIAMYHDSQISELKKPQMEAYISIPVLVTLQFGLQIELALKLITIIEVEASKT